MTGGQRATAALCAGLALLLLSACGGDDATAERDGTGQETPDDVTFALSWLPVAEAAGWYSAWDQGWFEEKGIDAEIVRGFGSGDTAKRVATGETDFGIVDMSALVPLRLNEDIPVLTIASYYPEPPHAVIFRTGEGIEEPGDLEGRSIACSANNANMLMFPAFAAATGIDEDSIDWVLTDPGANNSLFASGETDATCDFITTIPILEGMADDEFDYFSYAEHGVEGYSQTLVTTETMIEERPDLVERFLRAALRGAEFAVEQPQEAVGILASHEPEQDHDILLEAWQMTLDNELMSNDDTERHGLGHISEERMQATFDTLVEAGALDVGDYTAEDLYTTDFLP